jgi:hypothetical protein
MAGPPLLFQRQLRPSHVVELAEVTAEWIRIAGSAD